MSALAALPYGRQSISEADIDAVVAVLRSDWLTQGPAVPAFEQAVAQVCGSAHAVAVNSATSALHIACLALGVGPGDRVWTSPNTFVASANCARYCGAEVDFVDIDPRTFNLCPERLAEKLERARAAGRLPKVVIPVHFAGQPCDMVTLAALARAYGFRIIEDASHAIGAQYQGEPVGCGRHSDITVLSFHPVKIITSGEGGMALTQDPALARRMQLLRSHGITREADELTLSSEGPWHYEQQLLGFNYRMTDLQAALGLSQLQRLREFVQRRQALAARYDQALAGLPLDRQHALPGARSAHHLYVVQVDEAGRPRAEVLQRLRAQGILCNVHYIPVHTQPDYRRLGFAPGDFPAAERYHRRALSLPLYAGLDEADQDRVVQALKEALQA